MSSRQNDNGFKRNCSRSWFQYPMFLRVLVQIGLFSGQPLAERDPVGCRLGDTLMMAAGAANVWHQRIVPFPFGERT